MRMRLTEKQALIHLEKEHGIRLGGSTYRREKTILKRLSKERLYHIAQIGYEDQHIEAIDEIENGIMLMWREFMKETKPLTRAIILEKIINMRPLLSSYYDATKGVIEKPEDTTQTVRESTVPESEQQQPNEWV